MKMPLRILVVAFAGMLVSSCHSLHSGHTHAHSHAHPHGQEQSVKVIRLKSGGPKPHVSQYGGSRTFVSSLQNRRRLSYARSHARMKARAKCH